MAASQLCIRATTRHFLVPDIAIVCREFSTSPESKDAITNPKVIVEILSPGSSDFDYGTKFDLYCNLPSLEEYVLIAQDEPRVDVFTKESAVRWILTKYEGLNATIRLKSLNLEIPATEIYAGVEFPPPDPDLT